MQLGMDVPRVYIVPVERFCREQGPSLGVNLAVSPRINSCNNGQSCFSRYHYRNSSSQLTLPIL